MANNLDLLYQERTYSLIWEKTTTGENFNKTVIPANLLKHDRQYLLRIKTNLEGKSFKVIPFRTRERERERSRK